jgi:alkanesulfonate monooxygenase SsuD/methylene tetrahydromethanopterin reductase-like flavin-dependent oxidoreductase (luciferase family)
MKIGVGIDDRLGLSLAQQRQLVQEAARLGYDSLWTPAHVGGRSGFHTCVQWWQATADVVPQGLGVGISVVPFPVYSVPSLAAEAATVSDLTGGKFSLGIGLGSYAAEGFRKRLGLPSHPPVTFTRDYLKALRALLSGQPVEHASPGVELHGLQLTFKAPPTPVYLAALGPQMVRLAGAQSDGLTPNWSSAEQLATLRHELAEGASRARRDPATVPIAQYIRVCVDEDETAARRAFTENMLSYAMARPGQRKDQGYRAHFARMGFDAVLSELEARNAAGTPVSDLLDEVPSELLLRVGYFGKPAGAADALRRLSRGLDEAMVRLICPPARRGDLDAAVASIRACQPAGWRA